MKRNENRKPKTAERVIRCAHGEIMGRFSDRGAFACVPPCCRGALRTRPRRNRWTSPRPRFAVRLKVACRELRRAWRVYRCGGVAECVSVGLDDDQYEVSYGELGRFAAPEGVFLLSVDFDGNVYVNGFQRGEYHIWPLEFTTVAMPTTALIVAAKHNRAGRRRLSRHRRNVERVLACSYALRAELTSKYAMYCEPYYPAQSFAWLVAWLTPARKDA